ncbi:hypothetical protein GGD46_003700 [Rhizobium lusitanum]|uniref:Uncharacterized protein n=1 Tax=Rhizobium lusitanum TaxID=293958 RepID=A0A7X0ISK3_9HYPH|nr:hypothetical protein [Rhizobium lusitanum]
MPYLTTLTAFALRALGMMRAGASTRMTFEVQR